MPGPVALGGGPCQGQTGLAGQRPCSSPGGLQARACQTHCPAGPWPAAPTAPHTPTGPLRAAGSRPTHCNGAISPAGWPAPHWGAGQQAVAPTPTCTRLSSAVRGGTCPAAPGVFSVLQMEKLRLGEEGVTWPDAAVGASADRRDRMTSGRDKGWRASWVAGRGDAHVPRHPSPTATKAGPHPGLL